MGEALHCIFAPLFIYLGGSGEVNPKGGIIWSANKSTVFGDFGKPRGHLGLHSKPGELVEKLQFTTGGSGPSR